uniref:NCK adaptor protein 2 n=1 Tax=Macaca fascicularis TaxID=9541 RepID=A0A7N9D878_MACFA
MEAVTLTSIKTPSKGLHENDRRSYCDSQVGLHRPAGPGAGHQEERAAVVAGRLQDVVAGEERGQQDGLCAVQLRGAEEQPEEGLPGEEPEGHTSPATSPCPLKRQGRTNTSRCSSWTMSTALGSGASTPWTSWWSTTKRRPSSPASTGRSSTSSGLCSDGAPAPHSPPRPHGGAARPALWQRLLPQAAPTASPRVSLCSGRLVGLSPIRHPGLTPTLEPTRPASFRGGEERGEFTLFLFHRKRRSCIQLVPAHGTPL